MILNEKLIGEIQVFMMPIVLSDGIELFESIPNEALLTRVETKKYATGGYRAKV